MLAIVSVIRRFTERRALLSVKLTQLTKRGLGVSLVDVRNPRLSFHIVEAHLLEYFWEICLMLNT